MSNSSSIEIQPVKTKDSLSVARSEEQDIVENMKLLVENGDISEARDLLSTISSRKYPKVEHWRKTLTEPNARREKTATGGGLQEDSEWLHKNSMNYKGQWVALKHGVFLGSHKSLVTLHHMLKQSDTLTGAMLFQIGH